MSEYTIEDIAKDPKIIRWFTLTNLSKNSQVAYLKGMKDYCNISGKLPSKLIEESIAEIKAGKLPSERTELDYFVVYLKTLESAASNTKMLYISAIKSFYKCYDVQLSNSIGKNQKPQPLKENKKFIKKEDIVNLITNIKNLREKSVVLMMATSGLARAEILNLKFGDIEIDSNDIGTISMRREKKEVDFVTFCSPEAVHALRAYVNERNRKVIKTIEEKEVMVEPVTAVKGKDDYIYVTYDKGVNINPHTFSELFNILSKELGYANGKGFVLTRSHALRKWFSSTLENAGMPKNKVDFMMGHKVNAVDTAYFFQNIPDLKELYIRYLPYLKFEETYEIKTLTGDDAKALHAENEMLKQNLKLVMEVLGIDPNKSDAQQQLEDAKRRIDKTLFHTEPSK